MSAATILRIITIGYTAALWLPALYCLGSLRRCPQPRAGRRRVGLSIIVPALNEERRLPPLLQSLAAQRQGSDELIVVDDGSTDRTASIAAASGATVIAAPPRPAGWTGKTWACAVGASRSRAELLIFLDADTVIEPGGLERLAETHQRHGGVVSVQPYHVVKRPYEQLSAYFNAVVMGSIGAFTPQSGARAAAGVFGPCLIISRTDYAALGGHASVREQIVEDLALGELARSRSLAITAFAGRGTVSFRMYPEGIGTLVEGWSRSMASGATRSPALPKALMSAWLTGATSCAIVAVTGAAALARGGPAGGAFAAASLACYLLYALQLAWILRRIGSFSFLASLLFPIPLFFFHAVFARSVWLARVGGSVKWRGRAVALGRDRPRRAAGGRP